MRIRSNRAQPSPTRCKDTGTHVRAQPSVPFKEARPLPTFLVKVTPVQFTSGPTGHVPPGPTEYNQAHPWPISIPFICPGKTDSPKDLRSLKELGETKRSLIGWPGRDVVNQTPNCHRSRHRHPDSFEQFSDSSNH